MISCPPERSTIYTSLQHMIYTSLCLSTSPYPCSIATLTSMTGEKQYLQVYSSRLTGTRSIFPCWLVIFISHSVNCPLVSLAYWKNRSHYLLVCISLISREVQHFLMLIDHFLFQYFILLLYSFCQFFYCVGCLVLINIESLRFTII